MTALDQAFIRAYAQEGAEASTTISAPAAALYTRTAVVDRVSGGFQLVFGAVEYEDVLGGESSIP